MNVMPAILKVDYIGPSRIQYSGTLSKSFTLTNVSSDILPREHPIDYDKITLVSEKTDKKMENDRK